MIEVSIPKIDRLQEEKVMIEVSILKIDRLQEEKAMIEISIPKIYIIVHNLVFIRNIYD
jgi:uncharacterized protein (UPF0335 family)